jgi:hypothetical protein
MRTLMILLLSLASLAGCKSGSTAGEPAGARVPFETIDQRSVPGGSGGQQREVIRDETAWRAAWQELGAGGEPPAVDFSRDMVILAAMETQSCVSRVTIRSVLDAGSELVVDLLEAPPAPNCVCVTAERPFHAVRLRRSDEPARFVAERGQTNC